MGKQMAARQMVELGVGEDCQTAGLATLPHLQCHILVFFASIGTIAFCQFLEMTRLFPNAEPHFGSLSPSTSSEPQGRLYFG